MKKYKIIFIILFILIFISTCLVFSEVYLNLKNVSKPTSSSYIKTIDDTVENNNVINTSNSINNVVNKYNNIVQDSDTKNNSLIADDVILVAIEPSRTNSIENTSSSQTENQTQKSNNDNTNIAHTVTESNTNAVVQESENNPITHESSTEISSILPNESLPYYIKVNVALNTITVYAKDINGEHTVPYKSLICSTGTATPLSRSICNSKQI